MLREALKQEIDQLTEEQLKKLVDFVDFIKQQTQRTVETKSVWEHATAKERADDLCQWVTQLSQTNVTLPDEAFDRASIYE
jgi:hypothetical protein